MDSQRFSTAQSHRCLAPLLPTRSSLLAPLSNLLASYTKAGDSGANCISDMGDHSTNQHGATNPNPNVAPPSRQYSFPPYAQNAHHANVPHPFTTSGRPTQLQQHAPPHYYATATAPTLTTAATASRSLQLQSAPNPVCATNVAVNYPPTQQQQHSPHTSQRRSPSQASVNIAPPQHTPNFLSTGGGHDASTARADNAHQPPAPTPAPENQNISNIGASAASAAANVYATGSNDLKGQNGAETADVKVLTAKSAPGLYDYDARHIRKRPAAKSLMKKRRSPISRPTTGGLALPSGVGAATAASANKKPSDYAKKKFSSPPKPSKASKAKAAKSSKVTPKKKTTAAKVTKPTQKTKGSKQGNQKQKKANSPPQNATTPSKKNTATAKEKADASSAVWEGQPNEDLGGGRKWPKGWIKRLFSRRSGASVGQTDRYWYSPKQQYKLRSMVEVKKFLRALEMKKGDEVEAKKIFKSVAL